jgi:hypothetical protein
MTMRFALMTAALVFVSLAGIPGDARAQAGVCGSLCNCDFQCIDFCAQPCTSTCVNQMNEMHRQCKKACNMCNTLLRRKNASERKKY